MKLWMLTLLFGLVYADLNHQNTGDWKLMKAGVTNNEESLLKNSQRFNLWNFQCQDIKCKELYLNPYFKRSVTVPSIFDAKNCAMITIKGVKDEDSDTYISQFHGIWNYNFCYQSESTMIICTKYTDFKGDAFNIVELLVRPGEELTDEANEEFKKWLEYYKIPESDVLDIKEEDRCSVNPVD